MSAASRPVYIAFLVVCIVFAFPFLTCAGWCFYDGFVYFPQQREQALEWERVRDEFPETYPQEWKKLAEANGWPTAVNEIEHKTEADIVTQYVMGGVCSFLSFAVVVGAVVFGVLLKKSRPARPPDMVFSDTLPQ